jgi:hypothetical protein
VSDAVCKKMQGGYPFRGRKRGQRRGVAASSVRDTWGLYSGGDSTGRFRLVDYFWGYLLWEPRCERDDVETLPDSRHAGTTDRDAASLVVKSRLEALHFSRNPERPSGREKGKGNT